MGARIVPMTDLDATAPGAPAPGTRWVVVSRPRGEEEPRGQDAASTGRLLAWVAASGVLALVAVAVVGVFAARTLAEREAVNDAATTADLLAEAVVQPVLVDRIAQQDPEAVAALDEAVREYLETTSIVRIKLWTADGTIVYSDERRLLGQTYELGDDELEVLQDPQTRADISDLSEPENRFERGGGPMLEVYRPVWTPNGTRLLFETYAPYDEVDSRSGELWRGFAGVTVSTLLFFTALLVPIGWRLLSRLRKAQQQRETLLQEAVEASLEERRRIAGTLHDGMVQELAAASFTVSGAAARADTSGDPQLGADLHGAAGTLRSSIGSLRSLLVDIYPANLDVGGLGEALGDLASSLRTLGITVQVDLGDDGATLGPDHQRLVFRVAQECLHNVRRHAGASEVVIALRREAGEVGDRDHVVLDVADDGRGFDPTVVLARPPHGHFGLRVLGDVASRAGAELLLDTAPGAGCHWRLRVPTS